MSKSIRCLLLSAGLLLVTTVARGQAVPESDVLDEVIVDHHGATINHPIRIAIPETPAEGGPFTFTVPALTIDFHDPGVTGQTIISDRLHLDPFVVRVTSDTDPGGLAPRSNAKLIPAAANEKFLPLTVDVHSDGDNPNITAGESDHVRIVLGSFAGGGGSVFLDVPIPEPFPEGSPEPVIDFVVPAQFYDVAEPGTIGTAGFISDYFDHEQVHGFFISSANQSDYDPALIVDGVVLEDGLATDPFFGGALHYELRFASDGEVPEPGTIVLLGLGLAGLVATRGRRFLAKLRR